MLVTVEFEKNGLHYPSNVVASPNVLKFQTTTTNKKQTTLHRAIAEKHNAVTNTVKMSPHVPCAGTEHLQELFPSMRQNDQRAIIEQLLGITIQ